jgi:predicted amidohydrolase
MTSAGSDQQANLEKAETWCRHAKVKGAHLALMPEMFNCGYQGFDPENREAFRNMAIGPETAYFRHFVALARELEMAIGLTYLEKWDPEPRNTISIVDRQGAVILTYAKVHTCDFGPMESACTPGHDFTVSELDTGDDRIQIGSMICFDREAPESARILMLKGAEIILTPNACGLEKMRLDQFQTRAFENTVGVAMTNYAAPQHNGHSVAYHSDGSLIVEGDEDEGIFMAGFDLEAIRGHRQRTIWGNAYRRPHRYDLLTSRDIKDPYLRKNGFGEPFNPATR